MQTEHCGTNEETISTSEGISYQRFNATASQRFSNGRLELISLQTTESRAFNAYKTQNNIRVNFTTPAV